MHDAKLIKDETIVLVEERREAGVDLESAHGTNLFDFRRTPKESKNEENCRLQTARGDFYVRGVARARNPPCLPCLGLAAAHRARSSADCQYFCSDCQAKPCYMYASL